MSDRLHQEARALTEELVRDRRHLHQHPELAGSELETAAYIAERLRGLGLEPRLLLDSTAVVADIEGSLPGEVLLLRADIDALPIQERGEERPYRSLNEGRMHACGHDGHVAIALAATRLLLARRGELAGTVRVAFQPAEEVAGGAQRMIDAGALDSPTVTSALGLHLWSGEAVGAVGVRVGAIFASADEFMLEIRGRGGHGALPHQALDPIPIASLVILGLQTLVSRETSPLASAVVTVGMVSAGRAFNIIPEEVRLSGTLRTFSQEERQRLLRRVEEVAKGISAAFGAEAHLRLGASSPPVISDQGMAELVRQAVRESEGAELVEPEPITVGDDVGVFLERVPGCYFLIGAGDPKGGFTAPHHHPDFDIDEACLPIGAEVLARAALLRLRRDQ